MHQIVAETSSLWPRWSVDAVQTRLFESPKLSATLLVIWLSIFLRMSFYLSSWDSRIKAGPVICDGVVTTKPVQRSSDLQPVRAPRSVAALKQKLVAFSAWVGGLVYAFTNVYSQVWKLFGMIFYLRVIRVARFWVWGGGGGSSQRRATEQVWQELKHQQCEAPSGMTGRWRTDYYCLKSHR